MEPLVCRQYLKDFRTVGPGTNDMSCRRGRHIQLSSVGRSSHITTLQVDIHACTHVYITKLVHASVSRGIKWLPYRRSEEKQYGPQARAPHTIKFNAPFFASHHASSGCRCMHARPYITKLAHASVQICILNHKFTVIAAWQKQRQTQGKSLSTITAAVSTLLRKLGAQIQTIHC